MTRLFVPLEATNSKLSIITNKVIHPRCIALTNRNRIGQPGLCISIVIITVNIEVEVFSKQEEHMVLRKQGNIPHVSTQSNLL